VAIPPEEGLALLDRIDGLDRYHLLHSARVPISCAASATHAAAAEPAGPARHQPPPAVPRPPSATSTGRSPDELSILDHGRRRTRCSRAAAPCPGWTA
jgi:hypothetical protein